MDIELLEVLFENKMFLLFFTIIATGILAAEARMALEVLHLHQTFNLLLLDKKDRKWILKSQFRFKRYIVGITTSFLAIIMLARELDSLNQSVIGLIAALSGNSFIMKQIDGNLQSALDTYLMNKATNELNKLEDELEELVDVGNNEKEKQENPA